MGDLHSPITNRSEAFKAIRKESLDVFNRLHSIDEDASFVSSIARAYPTFPVVGMNTMPYDIVILIINAVVSANRRCGIWYTDVNLV
jgi:tRNA A64-2'-O-ribosylphosphate transferase